jgi:hypothetical protein
MDKTFVKKIVRDQQALYKALESAYCNICAEYDLTSPQALGVLDTLKFNILQGKYGVKFEDLPPSIPDVS